MPLLPGKQVKLDKPALQRPVEHRDPPGGPQTNKFDGFKIGGDEPGGVSGIFSFEGIADHFFFIVGRNNTRNCFFCLHIFKLNFPIFFFFAQMFSENLREQTQLFLFLRLQWL